MVKQEEEGLTDHYERCFGRRTEPELVNVKGIIVSGQTLSVGLTQSGKLTKPEDRQNQA